MAELDRQHPDYAPLRFLKGEVQDLVGGDSDADPCGEFHRC